MNNTMTKGIVLIYLTVLLQCQGSQHTFLGPKSRIPGTIILAITYYVTEVIFQSGSQKRGIELTKIS